MQFSDIRLKTDINDLVDALEIVKELEGKCSKGYRDNINNYSSLLKPIVLFYLIGKTYCWKAGTPMESENGGKRVIGLIAQEVQKVLPEVTTSSFLISIYQFP